jgi:hypothetical protein
LSEEIHELEPGVSSHPQSNAWIAKDADKSNRIDAYKLADLLRLNRFKEVHCGAAAARFQDASATV